MGRFYEWTEDGKATYRADKWISSANNDLVSELKIKKNKEVAATIPSPAPSF